MKKILIVDDEAQILNALARLFMDSDFEVVVARGGQEALELVEQEEFNLILCDMKMPYIDGYELLSIVKEISPKTVRIILSGYADEKVVFKALQKNIARLYVFKPWKNEELVKLIESILETEEILTNKHLLEFINNIENLPVMKSNYQHMIDLINDDVDINTISGEIEKDISIAAKILNVANSAFYGSQTGSVKQAVSYIGLQNTKNLIVSVAVTDVLDDRHHGGELISSIWRHAFLSNKLLVFLYEKHLHKKIPEICSSAALFHNIGSVFFLKCFYLKYIEILEKERRDYIAIVGQEMDAFGVTHNEAGAYLLEWWEFPFPVIETALYHHNPMDEKVVNREIVCAVHIVAKYTMEMLGYEWTDPFDERTFEFLNISKSDFEASLSEFSQ